MGGAVSLLALSVTETEVYMLVMVLVVFGDSFPIASRPQDYNNKTPILNSSYLNNSNKIHIAS